MAVESESRRRKWLVTEVLLVLFEGDARLIFGFDDSYVTARSPARRDGLLFFSIDF
jgi:hypothetical protein